MLCRDSQPFSIELTVKFVLAGYGVVDCEFRLLEYDWRRRTQEASTMSTTRGKSGKQVQKNGPAPAASVSDASDTGAVLTLSEAAAYLRVAESQVQRLAEMRVLPGRQIGGEWRFLKAGLQDWLRAPDPGSGKEAFLALAGVWRDDPDIELIVQEAHRRRGRISVE
jgi:excisionase family DNA binding protein